jgi:NAD-dependent deacetylase
MIAIPDALVSALRLAQKVTALTGAGISAESGVPTFRDAQTGMWARFRAEDLATPQAFRRQPRLVWEWYLWRREMVAKAQPNPGHYALVEMEKHIPEFTLITQNVDGLHLLAGSGQAPGAVLLELHGNIQRTKCFEKGHPVDRWEDTGDVPPLCPQCKSLLRPDVVWFGENLPQRELHAALETSRNCDVFLSIGTSGLVQPAASMPLLALQEGAILIEINPTETPLTGEANYVLRGPSGEILPRLVKATWTG